MSASTLLDDVDPRLMRVDEFLAAAKEAKAIPERARWLSYAESDLLHLEARIATQRAALNLLSYPNVPQA